ncbi:hypothetical protein EH165_03615 [Nakamurella antarctica]|uniref:Uncharacterized protein n=1 Tax=Nakamurella antarctica TaxID=1902245 RepID=A0A3G8ZJD5_9ACTN|nr:hypothetical protein [Nakamurella antarctica]AZI57383.1 hypothetical protein EH165_03615 [Nakamurella antarctica]
MTRPDSQLSDIVRRLRVWSLSSWKFNGRAGALRDRLQTLADLTAGRLGRSPLQVPDVGAHALVDQLIVLVADAHDAGVPRAEIDEQLHRVASELGLVGNGAIT